MGRGWGGGGPEGGVAGGGGGGEGGEGVRVAEGGDELVGELEGAALVVDPACRGALL